MKINKFVAGLGVGVVIGVLFAPKKGSELRGDIKEKGTDLYDKASSMTKEDYQELFSKKIDDMKKAIDEFDIHEFKDATSKKLGDLKDKVEELADAVQDSKEYDKVKTALKKISGDISEKVEVVKAKVKNNEEVDAVVVDDVEAIENEIDVVLEDLKD